MPFRNTKFQYGSITKFLHWLIAFLVVFMLCIGYLMQEINNKIVFAQVINIHKLTGLTILTLMIIRAFWALFNPKPVLPENTPMWQHYAERGLHLLFYIVLIMMPIAGWIMSVAAGHNPKLFSWEITLPIVKSKNMAMLFEGIHNALAIVLIIMISIHVIAALYHLLYKKDNILRRMLPGSD
ncbi:MAG: cytochrome b [Gammaproteobacteria bacterium]